MYGALPPLPWLRAFDASARCGNFTLAAAELGLTPSAVSYQVRGLEAKLGHKLFHRSRNTLQLTRLGQAYLPVVGRAFADIGATTASLFGSAGPAEVTLRCVSSLNLLWLVPRIARFRADHPQVRLRLLSASWTELAEGEELDIDIRYGDGGWQDGEVRPLMHGEVLPVCAPDRAGGCVTALAEGPLIELAGVVDGWQHYFAQHLPGVTMAEPVCKVDQSLIALEMAARGLGHALVADVFARPYLADGRLVRAAAQGLPARQGHYLVLPGSTGGLRPGAAALADWLQGEAQHGQGLPGGGADR